MIVILGAMDAEIKEFLNCLQERVSTTWPGGSYHRGTIDGHQVIVARSGVGKVMATMTCQYLISQFAPQSLIFTGLAGSLRREIGIGDTLFARDLIQHDLDCTVAGYPRGSTPDSSRQFIECDKTLLTAAAGYQPEFGTTHQGRICTGDQFITHREMSSHEYLHGELFGDAVEMEGAAVALTCAIYQVPCLVARTISDMADDGALVDFNSFLPIASRNSLSLVRYLLPLI